VAIRLETATKAQTYSDQSQARILLDFFVNFVDNTV
jgi:hypothetical protein